MESSKSVSATVSFMQQMLRNKFLLLTVVLAVGVTAYIGITLFKLIGH